MARRLSRSDKEKWAAAPPPPPRRPPLRIPASDNTALIATNKLTLVGRVTNPLLQNTRAVVNFLPRRVEGRDLGSKKFQIRFQSENDMEVVFNKGPYHYKKWMLLLQKWEPVVSESFPDKISFWIRIHGIPLHFCNEATIDTISDSLGLQTGKVVEEAKVRVEFNGLQPLEMSTEIQLPSDDIITVEFEYLKMEKHCFTCFSLFHEDESCPVKPPNTPPIKERKLGITQRLALQRIEADKRRHEERRGYRRPAYSQQPSENRREDLRPRIPHFSDNRDSRRAPFEVDALGYKKPYYRSSQRSPSEESRHSSRNKSRILSSGVKVQNQDVPIDPLSNPHGASRSRSLSSHTPSPRNLRERMDFPLEANGSGGSSRAHSSERRSALARIGSSSRELIQPPRGPTSFDSNRLQEVEIVYDDRDEQDHISPFQARFPEIGQNSRVPASLRLGGSSEVIVFGSVNEVASPSAHVDGAKTKGKGKATKTAKVGKGPNPTTKKRGVARSPLHGVNLKKSNVALSMNPPKKKLCIEKDPSLPCDKAGPSTTSRTSSRTRGADFRSPPPPFP